MWEQWNRELKNPESAASLHEHARLDASITLEYANLITLSVKDRRWFSRTQEVVFTNTIEYNQQWLESVSSAQAHYA
jgi:hypothetical protein